MHAPIDTTPASPPLIRRAVPEDADALARLRYAFRLERRGAAAGEAEFVARCATWMRTRLREDSHWKAWVAGRESSLIGHVWLQIVEKIPNPGLDAEQHGYVSNFFVIPRERNSGAGTQLLRAAVGHCRSIGVDTVFLWPTERSRPLYRRIGFTTPTDMLVMDLHLPKQR